MEPTVITEDRNHRTAHQSRESFPSRQGKKGKSPFLLEQNGTRIYNRIGRLILEQTELTRKLRQDPLLPEESNLKPAGFTSKFGARGSSGRCLSHFAKIERNPSASYGLDCSAASLARRVRRVHRRPLGEGRGGRK